MTIKECEAQMADEINALGDCLDQYSYLIAKSGQLPPMEETARDKCRLVAGCQSKVWIGVEIKAGRVHLEMDSDALVIRGVLALLGDLLEGRTVQEIIQMEPFGLFERTELAVTFSSERRQGIDSMIRQIQEDCMRSTDYSAGDSPLVSQRIASRRASVI